MSRRVAWGDSRPFVDANDRAEARFRPACAALATITTADSDRTLLGAGKENARHVATTPMPNRGFDFLAAYRLTAVEERASR